jgi:putative ABC transport system permease protein
MSMHSVVQNVRYSLRQLRKNPGFTAVAVLTLALGIGPNVAIFSVVWATFFKAVVPDENQVVVVWTKIKGDRTGSRADDYLQYLNQSKSFQHLDFAAWITPHLLSEDGSQEPIAGDVLTPGFHAQMMREEMLMGRDFLPEEGTPGHEHEVILTHGMWQSLFQSDPQILGKQIHIEDGYYTVVGVLKPELTETVKFTIPLALNASGRNNYMGNIFGRLKPGVTLQRVEAELNVIDKRLVASRQSDVPKDAWSIGVEKMKNDWLDSRSRIGLWILLAAVGFVLLIACANLANLLLAKGSNRQTEIAVRAALGATHRQVLGQLLVESLALAMLGGAVGVALGWVLLALVKTQLGGMLLLVTDANSSDINLPVILFAGSATALSGILFGCAPAWHVRKLNLSESLKHGAKSVLGGRHMRMQAALVIAEFGLATTLLAGTGMAIRSFWKLKLVDLGVRTDHLLVCQLSERMKYDPGNYDERARWHELLDRLRTMGPQLLDTLRALPGVADASLASTVPVDGYKQMPISIVGQASSPANPPMADFEVVTPGYLSTLGGRLVQGRFLDDHDNHQSQSVVVVNETFVRRYLNGANPLISRLILPRSQHRTELQIVGVFHDIRTGDEIADEPVPSVLGSFWQYPRLDPSLIVRGKPGATVNAREIRSVVAGFEPDVFVTEIRTMDEIVRSRLGGERFGSVLFTAFSALALLLAAVGVYGVMAFAVTQRHHEIGLRMAMGAQPGQLATMVLRDALKLVAIGLAIGFWGVFAVARLMHSVLYGIGHFNFEEFAVAALVLIVAATLASYIPARRAARVDPMMALRYE